MNEELASESSLDLTLMQHFCDENLKPRKVRAHLEIDPLRAWYYHIFLNSCTLVVLLQVDLASSDEPKIVCESCYETEDTSIFGWFLILDVTHYYWLHCKIHRLFLNSKENYLVHTIQRILDFL